MLALNIQDELPQAENQTSYLKPDEKNQESNPEAKCAENLANLRDKTDQILDKVSNYTAVKVAELNVE